MRIAFCHNLKTSDALDEAEYDTRETVDRLARALRSGGDEVVLVNMNGSVAQAAALLESLRPDLVFNTAEGRRGRLREAFAPCLYEQLELPFTGGDAYCCAVTLDKQLTKERVAREGVPTPRAVFVSPLNLASCDGALRDLPYPVLAKPNFEGSSLGISSRNVFTAAPDLLAGLRSLLAQFPAGILVEELIHGRDVTVGFLEALEPPVLEPTGYRYQPHAENPYNLYDFRLKNHASDEVEVVIDPGLEPRLARQIREWTHAAAKTLEVRDVGRFDFRLSPDGRAYFLEANALPSLEDGAGLLLAAERRGLDYDQTILAIVGSAKRRYGIVDRKTPAARGRSPRLRIGLTYNLKRTDTAADDTEAEFDSPRTIAGLRVALEELGHEVVELEATRDLPRRLGASAVDLVFNIAEGLRGRNRESHVPGLCEFLGIPCTGSDAATLSICLDKAIAKRLLLQAGVPTPAFVLLAAGDDPLPEAFVYPAIVKPNAEGTSKGLDERSVVEDETALRALARRLLRVYGQPVIAEEYVSGREVTVGLVGWPEPRVLEPMEIVFTRPEWKHPVYHYELKLDFSEHTRFECPAELSPRQASELAATARGAFEALGCRDVARIDFRLPASGSPQVIEVNPLPGLSPNFSDLCLIAQGSGLSYSGLVEEILRGAMGRRAAAMSADIRGSAPDRRKGVES